jgi:hypothetical protein
MEVTMKTIVLMGAAALLTLSALPAQAGYDAPFCRRVNGGAWTGAYDDCSYRSFEQCRMSAVGVGGFCVQNPYFAGAPYPRGREVRRRPPPGYERW